MRTAPAASRGFRFALRSLQLRRVSLQIPGRVLSREICEECLLKSFNDLETHKTLRGLFKIGDRGLHSCNFHFCLNPQSKIFNRQFSSVSLGLRISPWLALRSAMVASMRSSALPAST